jgi:hypothetical protein
MPHKLVADVGVQRRHRQVRLAHRVHVECIPLGDRKRKCRTRFRRGPKRSIEHRHQTSAAATADGHCEIAGAVSVEVADRIVRVGWCFLRLASFDDVDRLPTLTVCIGPTAADPRAGRSVTDSGLHRTGASVDVARVAQGAPRSRPSTPASRRWPTACGWSFPAILQCGYPAMSTIYPCADPG